MKATGASGSVESIIRARGVCHAFGVGDLSKQVLFDIDFDLAPGEIIIMTGPSGSGKSTLLTLIGALRRLQAGGLRVLGRELSALDDGAAEALRREIGFIFQHHNLFESLSARKNVELAMELSAGVTPARGSDPAAEILEAVGLGERIYYKPDSLSGGQRQRVAVARALVNRPRMVLADEPTAALDKKSGRQVVSLLQKMAQVDGTAVIIVSHDNRILDVADRIVNLVDGRVVSDVKVARSLEICKFLSEMKLFREFTPGTLSAIADAMEHERYEAGDVLIRQGDEGDKFYVLRSGSVKVLETTNGVDREVATLTKGEFFGEAALLTGEPRNATVRARDPVEVFSLGREKFQETVADTETFKEQLLKTLFLRQ